ncbi:hypothetical protein SLV14_007070 [Streptomyces sp. Je 1-4]|uniref:hypothetical protein n=1 Tax=Streptomyces TaxID=1883 RepID=UPI0021D9E87D|nr:MULTISPECIES: hypothetical protein [unclassified Streptomyces]UYB44014.1 hypothetical protein SLV14_007070 [Streptomyces sp. Je 1-4]UZQ40446.1 hypothetical protein SLV14N_007070 [Streptomyces sp. Je 1-4] [Streptomyces sp. Je 1-4 4N24]UZQ47863.1 hypothetical protein SLV14NA_007070 [Streptomyces sp. Je 1-4] [Streptomyces sp. Je 1-4 4N24_ara]
MQENSTPTHQTIMRSACRSGAVDPAAAGIAVTGIAAAGIAVTGSRKPGPAPSAGVPGISRGVSTAASRDTGSGAAKHGRDADWRPPTGTYASRTQGTTSAAQPREHE